MKNKLIPKHQTPFQPLEIQDVDWELIPEYTEYLKTPYKEIEDFPTWLKKQIIIQSNNKNEKVSEDKRSKKQRDKESKQGEAIHNQQQRKKLEAKVNRGIWTGIGLGGLALAQTTPAAPFIDAAFATHGALGLAKQYEEGTLGLNLETGLHALEMLPLGIRGVGKAVKYADDVAREAYAPYDFYRTIQETTPQVEIPFREPLIRIGDVEVNIPYLSYRQGKRQIVSDFQKTGQVKTNLDHHKIQKTSTRPYDINDKATWFTISDFKKDFQNPMFAQGGLWYGIPTQTSNNTGLLVTAEKLDLANKGSGRVNSLYNGTNDILYYTNSGHGVRRIPTSSTQLNPSNTTAYIFDPNYGYRLVRKQPTTYLGLYERPSSLTNAETLGLPKQVRHSMTTDQADAVDDLVQYINSGQHRQVFRIDPETGHTLYTTKTNDKYPTYLRWFADNNKQMRGAFARTTITDDAGLTGEVRYLVDKNLASWQTIPPNSHKLLTNNPGEAVMFGNGTNGYNIRLTSPRVDQDIYITDLLESPIKEDQILGQTLANELSTTLDKNTMKSFWQGVSRTQRPGTYLTGDPGISPVGNSLIQEYRSNRFKNGISLLPHKSTIIARTGLSPDSYSSIIRQALREGNELRWGQGFTNWNPSAVVNKHIYDTWRKYTKGEITAEEYKTIFDEWAKALGGREATIRRIPERTEFVKDNLGNITEKVIPAKEFVIIPHPYIYKKKHGGRIKK